MKTLSVMALIFFSATPFVSVAQDRGPFEDSDAESGAVAQEVKTSPAGSARIDAHFVGSLECSVCHVSPQTKYRLDGVTEFVALDEFRLWLNDDPHSQAYLGIIPEKDHFEYVRKQLVDLNDAVNKAVATRSGPVQPVNIPEWGASNELSRSMLQKMFAEKFGANVESLFQRIADAQETSGGNLISDQIAQLVPQLKSTMQQCLSCHAGWDKRQANLDLEVIKYGTGVSCEACHGASSDWLADHSRPEWRSMDPRLKESKYGQYDMRDPISRAELCYSCHIGDVEQGKVVTHEMYAAGHPPLPGIEIESFADQLPRHWRNLNEKPDFNFADDFKKFYGLQLTPGEDRKNGVSIPWSESELPRTKNLLVAGVIASAQSIEMMADLASKTVNPNNLSGNESSTFDPTAAWPEFATFDCAACHHDLKGVGRERGFAGVPGRPPAPYWPRVVSNLGVSYLGTRQQGEIQEAFQNHQSAFQSVLDDQPFGEPDELAKAAKAYATWLGNEVANQIESTPLTREDAFVVLQLLCGSHPDSHFKPEQETWDFHSARQLAWSINQVYTEITQAGVRGQSQRNDSYQPPDTDFGRILNAMQESLMLELPAKGEITNQQPQYLRTWRDFDRQQFFEELEALRTALQTDTFVNEPPTPVDQVDNRK